ncbi:MAG: NADH-quinone oxidoreductase subunit N, partial [Prevotella sp.]|nr:NADH-quinone oxidoreductase subunit N [Prevotella sp.]
MNYSEFLKMIPEAFLVLSLIIVFALDFAFSKNDERRKRLGLTTVCLLLAVIGTTVSVIRQEGTVTAFGGLYVTSHAVTMMKIILAFGTLIVVIMAQPWVEKTQRLAGEFYMLILSTLLGMFVMMSSGNFMMFFLGLEMASV